MRAFIAKLRLGTTGRLPHGQVQSRQAFSTTCPLALAPPRSVPYHVASCGCRPCRMIGVARPRRMTTSISRVSVVWVLLGCVVSGFSIAPHPVAGSALRLIQKGRPRVWSNASVAHSWAHSSLETTSHQCGLAFRSYAQVPECGRMRSHSTPRSPPARMPRGGRTPCSFSSACPRRLTGYLPGDVGATSAGAMERVLWNTCFRSTAREGRGS